MWLPTLVLKHAACIWRFSVAAHPHAINWLSPERMYPCIQGLTENSVSTKCTFSGFHMCVATQVHRSGVTNDSVNKRVCRCRPYLHGRHFLFVAVFVHDQMEWSSVVHDHSEKCLERGLP